MDARIVHDLRQGAADSTEGLVTGVDFPARMVWVNAAGSIVQVPWAGPAPWVGDRVRLVRAGAGNVFCVLVEGASAGVVTAVSGPLVTVTGDDGVTYVYPHVGAAPSVGARVRVDHAGRCVLGVYAGTAGTPEVVPSTPPPALGGSGTFSPTWSGSWRLGGFASTGVESSQNRVAGFGFGTQIVDTVPAAATVTKAELLLTVEWNRSFSSAPVRFGVHSHATQPGALTAGDLTGTLNVPQGQTRVDVMWLMPALRGSGRGLGIYPDSAYWIRYAPAPTSGQIYLEWSA